MRPQPIQTFEYKIRKPQVTLAMDALKAALRLADFHDIDFTPREPGKVRVCSRDNAGFASVYVHLNVPDTYAPGDIQALRERLDEAAKPYLFGPKRSPTNNE